LTDYFELGENSCGNVSDGGVIGSDESFESPYDPAPIVNITSPTGGNGTIEYLWLASTSGCPGFGDEVPNSNSVTYDPGPITQTTYYRRCSRTVGCTTYYESNCIVKEVTTSSTDCEITHSAGEDLITVSGLNGANIDLQVFDDNWDLIYQCSDDCNPNETISNLSDGIYYINAKIWNESWEKMCEYSEYVTVGGTNNLVVLEEDYLFFNASKNGQSVYLRWVTNTEDRNDHFIIERSRDNINFESIELINSEHTDRGIHHYQTIDKAPLVGDNYYRIKEVFIDGSFKYATSQKVYFDLDLSKINLFPNPAHSEVFLMMKDHVGRLAKIKIYNSLGVLMTTESFENLPEQAIRFDTKNFVAGVYMMNIKLDDLKSRNIIFVVSKK